MRTLKITTLILLIGIVVYGFINTNKNNSVNVVVNKDKPVEGLSIGNKAPELRFKDPNNKEIALSSLKGKMVLIDFWASWCGPCRRENPNVVSAYNKYKDSKFTNGKGFTIYSVSLDQNLDSWKKAIERDGLVWEYHVSDLKYWNSDAAKVYKVQGIPTNWLIDGDGIIVASNLRGAALETALESNLKK